MTVEECCQWVKEQVNGYVKITPWKLRKIFCQQVKFDPVLWKEVVPKIVGFWEDVEKSRVTGFPEKVPSKTKEEPLVKYKYIADSDEEA